MLRLPQTENAYYFWYHEKLTNLIDIVSTNMSGGVIEDSKSRV